MGTPAKETVPEALRRAVGEERVGRPSASDVVDGGAPRWVARADGTDSAAAILRVAAEHGMTVVPRGSGSKLDTGGPAEEVDLLLDLSAADEVLEHAASDLVVRAQAGARLRDVQDVVARAGQQLSVSDPRPTATLGGVIATGTSGPCRQLYGGVRDLLLGLTVVRADGTVARSGGKVVKNVAGYDLGKLFTGSYGTLGVVTEAIFRLHPLAAERRWVAVRVPGSESAAEAARLFRVCQAAPTGVELDRPAGGEWITVCAELEGRVGATAQRAEELARSFERTLGTAGEVLARAPEWWDELPHEPGGTLLRLASAPADLGELVERVGRVEREHGVSLALRGAAGLGVLHGAVPAGVTPETVARLVEGVRVETGRLAGYTTVVHTPRRVKELVDVWGPVAPGVGELMRRTKERFDPEHRLAPGRFVGGL
ncbi:FAD-binding oxidoreductase [Actinopolyspora mortivallis]|uniref:FAD-binding oxidoreductase n=1 Tax=Actinopolyspora mortivallis TaxID=33906 RepID=A0A2T0GVR6_ACTMO|nr:FAD-binding oxidoreductase [Actinopolyspora mortivallis]PRW63208.1 FAD-binding oxidoreductase [Actinopolyspora mortivallis]